MNWFVFLWLVLLIGFLAAETTTVTLISIWFAFGSLGAMLTALLGGPVWLQVVVFLVLAATTLLLLRPMVRKFIKPKITATNVDSLMNSQGYVTEDIDNVAAVGQVKLGAMPWTARSTDGTLIPKGTLVRVDRIEGVKAYVTAVKTPAEV